MAESPVTASTATATVASEPARADQRRDVPDYDGRSPPPPTAREGFIWIPRAILFPAHLVAEYVLRRPAVAFVRWGDEHHVFKRIYDFFTWDGGLSGVYPIANLNLGLKNTLGLALVDRNFLTPGNSVHVAWSWSTQGVLAISAQDRKPVFRDGTGMLSWGGHFTERPDGVFYGVGPATHREDKTFYSYVSRGGDLGLSGDLGGLSRAVIGVGYRDAHFGPSGISAPNEASAWSESSARML